MNPRNYKPHIFIKSRIQLNFSNKYLIMLEFQKFVLQQISDDRVLFKKELQKSILWLKPEEIENLKEWVTDRFGNTYNDTIMEVFYAVETNL